jgi:TRAP-type C4-dicarboxylate transport system permease small subunit
MSDDISEDLALNYSIGPTIWLEKILDITCAILLILMMLITTSDVVGRYLLHAPLQGAFESNELLLYVVVFVALPRVTWQNRHLTVSLIDNLLGSSAKRIQHIVVNGISGTILLILSWRLWIQATQIAEYGDRSNALNIPLAPLAFIVAVLTCLSAIAALLQPWFQHNAQQEPKC